MERVVDGPQQASWAPGLKESNNPRGQKVEMLVKPASDPAIHTRRFEHRSWRPEQRVAGIHGESFG